MYSFMFMTFRHKFVLMFLCHVSQVALTIGTVGTCAFDDVQTIGKLCK